MSVSVYVCVSVYVYVCVYVRVCLCVGLNTGSYYAIGTLLNTIILHYFPVCNVFYWHTVSSSSSLSLLQYFTVVVCLAGGDVLFSHCDTLIYPCLFCLYTTRLWTQHLTNHLWEFYQIHILGAVGDRDEFIRFWGRKLRAQRWRSGENQVSS